MAGGDHLHRRKNPGLRKHTPIPEASRQAALKKVFRLQSQNDGRDFPESLPSQLHCSDHTCRELRRNRRYYQRNGSPSHSSYRSSSSSNRASAETSCSIDSNGVFSGLHLAPNSAIYTPTGNRTNALLPCQPARRKPCRQPQPKAQCPAFPIAKIVHIGFSCDHHLLFVKLEVVSPKSGRLRIRTFA